MIFNGVRFDDFSVIEYVRRSLLPSRSVVARSSGGRIASHYIGIENDILQIEVDVRIIGENRRDVRETYRQMASVLATDEPGILVLRDEPGKYNIAVLGGDTQLHDFLHTGFVTLVFECPDPYLYSKELKVVNDIGGIPYINRGGAPSYGSLRIVIPEPTSRLEVSLEGLESSIVIEHSFKKDDIVSIDLESEDVWKNGDVYTPATLDSEFFMLPPGFFTINASDGVVDLVYRERWY